MTEVPVREGRRGWKRCFAALIGLGAAILVAELALRFLLLSQSRIALSLAGRLRNPDHFARGEDWWKLQHLLTDPARRLAAHNPDHVVGWTYGFDAATGGHPDEPLLRGRTPVLLYGDSFAQCMTPASECFAALLERSDLADRYGLLNYGVGGYGLDQMYLLMKGSLDRYRDLDPVVVIAVMVDDDLDRCALSFRCWPKPRLSIRDGALALEEPVVTDIDEYFERHPVGIRSYLLRLLAYGPVPLPESWKERLRPAPVPAKENEVRCRRILLEAHRELERRGLRHFVLLLHGDASLRRPADLTWQDVLVRDACAEHGIPWISSRPFFLAGSGGSAEETARFFGRSPRELGHYNRAGNAVAFEAIRAGILGRFDPPDTSRVARMRADGELEPSTELYRDLQLLGASARFVWRGERSCICWGTANCPPGAADEGAPRLALRGSERGPSELTFELDGRFARLRGDARRSPTGSAVCADATVVLRVRADGRTVLEEALPPHPAAVPLDLDLAGVSRLSIEAEASGPEPECAWIVFPGLRLEPRVGDDGAPR